MTEPSTDAIAARVNLLETGVAVLRSEQHGLCRRLGEESEAREKGDDVILSELRRIYWTLVGLLVTIAAGSVGIMLGVTGNLPG